MNSKGQFDFEFDPLSLGAGVLTGILSIVVMSKTDVGLIWRILAFPLGTIIGYIMFNKIING